MYTLIANFSAVRAIQQIMQLTGGGYIDFKDYQRGFSITSLHAELEISRIY